MEAVGVVDMDELDSSLNEVAGHLNAQHARLVDLTMQLLANEGLWSGVGTHTPELYLAWRTGISPERAHQIVQIARRVNDLPVCLEKFRRGELAVDQMAAIARRAPWWTDDEVADIGSHMTVSQLRRTLSGYNFPAISKPDDTSDNIDSPDANPESVTSSEDACESEPTDRCSFNVGEEDRFWLNLNTDTETGMIIETALAEARDSLFRAGQTEVTWVDAIREIAERSLDSIEEPSRRDRYRINIHVNTDNEAVDAKGWRLPDAIRRHITCDGLISPTFLADGKPVSVGRSQRTIPDRTRRVVQLRDGGCRVWGCSQHHFIEVHHIIHWEDGGTTDTCNLIALCPSHHRLHHRGKLGITGNADQPNGVKFTNENGSEISQTGAKPKPPGAPPPMPKGTYEHPDGERLQAKWLYFNPPPDHR